MATLQERTLTADQVERLAKLRDNMLSVSAALGAEKRSDVTVAELTLLLKQAAAGDGLGGRLWQEYEQMILSQAAFWGRGPVLCL